VKKSIDEIKAFCRGRSFCLLGNASSVLRKPKPIDRFGVVGRMNRGSPAGKGPLIGLRTDVLFLSTRMEGEAIQAAFHPSFVVWMTVDSWLASAWVRENAVLNPWRDWCELYLKVGAKPTTGLMALNFVIRHIEFSELVLYGFDFFKTPTWYNSSPGYRGPHDPAADKAAVLGLIEGRPNVRLIDES
jgi:hypothetical protein